MEFNKDLAKRFVSDLNLPIPIFEEEFFIYYLELYENEYKSLTKYIELCKLIKELFHNSPTEFLDYYYKRRDDIITYVENSASYSEFNQMDMKNFEIPKKYNVSNKNIFNQENVGGIFLSIDLKKANFQALKFVNKEIVRNTDTYEDFIGTFTNLNYIKESKYTRQVIFGKLNPKRHITIEKYITFNVLETYFRMEGCLKDSQLISLSNDEIIFKIANNPLEMSKELLIETKDIEDFIQKDTGFVVSANYFQLGGLQLLTEKDEPRQTMYVKHDFKSGKNTLKCVPVNYHAIVYKLFNGIKHTSYDDYFNYEGLVCKFTNDFKLNINFGGNGELSNCGF